MGVDMSETLFHVANRQRTIVRICTWNPDTDVFTKVGGGWAVVGDEIRDGDYDVVKIESMREHWD